MKCLLLTNQMSGWTGSETIIVEMAEHLLAKEHGVTVLCNQLDEGFVQPLRQLGACVTDDAKAVDLAGFDFCFSLHQMVNLLIEACLEREHRSFPYLCYGHLSPYEKLEFPGPLVEPMLADRVLANSRETLAKLRELGMPEARLGLFPNPAPDTFFDTPEAPARLRRILAVSNHMPQELAEALEALADAGVQVDRVGVQFGQARILAADIGDCDAVVTIGKTVQYALAARRPVFCYDRFGGPGWITADNFQASADFNFSGRPACNRMGKDEIAGALQSGYAQAQHFAAGFDARAAGFSLSQHMRNMLTAARIARMDRDRLKRLNRLFTSPQDCAAIRREAAAYQVLRQEKIHAHNLERIRAELEQALAARRDRSFSRRVRKLFRGKA